MLRRPLVLVIDPDEDTRTIIRSYFEYREFGVVVAADVDRGLELARRLRPDLVIGEFPVEVPGQPRLSDALRSAVGPHLPILVLTSWAATTDELEPAKAIGECALTKPTPPVRVFEEAERLLNRLDPHVGTPG